MVKVMITPAARAVAVPDHAPTAAVAGRDHGAIPPDHDVGVGKARRFARRLVEEQNLAALPRGGASAVFEERLERFGADAALLHAGAGVVGVGAEHACLLLGGTV